MCGIAGIVSREPVVANAHGHIEAMVSKLGHRGPDGRGTWHGQHAAMGQTRLSIIDLSNNGRQPMPNTDASLQLVCNGEIYNYKNLRLRLERTGYRFRSHTDVEVILPLYEQFGTGAIERLVGMFAIGLWDAKRHRLMLARDRIGEKPLYYAENDGMLAFASELKALLTLPWIDRRLDEEAITHLFAFQSLPAPFTIYSGIRQLAPAEILIWEDGRSQRSTYWHIDFTRKTEAWTGEAALETYGTLMRQAVSGQLVADVPVGVMLSGGIDSTTIARLAKERDPTIRTFCIGSNTAGQKDEEHERAEVAAQVLVTAHKNVTFGNFALGDLVRVIAHYDQPCSSFVALYADALAREMRREVKVVLTGNGADEVFAGYATYPMLAPIDLARRLVAPVAPAITALTTDRGGGRLQQLLTAARHGVAEWRGQAITQAARNLMVRLVTDTFLRRAGDAKPGYIVEEAVRRSNAQSMLQAATSADLMVCHQHGHSVIADMSGMTYGLEMRSPFLDHRVIEFAASLQPALQVGRFGRAADAKLITKKHLAQVMPDAIVNARKIGFGYGIPMDRLLRQTWRGAIERLLTNGRYLELGIFDVEGARWALANSYFASCLLVSFAVFAEVHIFGVPATELTEWLEQAQAA